MSSTTDISEVIAAIKSRVIVGAPPARFSEGGKRLWLVVAHLWRRAVDAEAREMRMRGVCGALEARVRELEAEVRRSAE
jgi:hypothetical protein